MSLWLLVLGLVAFIAGFIVYSLGWHEYTYHAWPDERLLQFDFMVFGHGAQIAGVTVAILGLVLLALSFVEVKSKGGFASIVLGVLVFGSGAIINGFGYHLYHYYPHPYFTYVPTWGEPGFVMMEYGRWGEGAGVALIILGIALYVAAFVEDRSSHNR